MDALWTRLSTGAESGNLKGDDEKLHKKWGKAMALLAGNPAHPGLHSHEIEPLSRRYGRKVFQSYLENRNPKASRMYWVYGPGRAEITVIGLEPHPEDSKNSGYDRVHLSPMGQELGRQKA
ncbi:MAG TPA: hypothetical protein VK914_04360 [bacterium]|nr:hypothetical protein [bacterium]